MKKSLIMKNIILTFIFCLIATFCIVGQQKFESVNISKEWKFQIGDNPEFINPEYNDQAWEKINPNDFWENQGYKDYDGIGWYRTRIVIPSSIKKNGELIKAVKISLGLIDDEDITYFNGQKIGSTSGWDTKRSYTIPFGLIHWDQENVIAIRVKDTGGNGGMHGGTYAIGAVELSDVLALSVPGIPVKFVTPNTKLSNSLNFHFKTAINIIQGTLKVKVYNAKSKAVVFQKDDLVTIGSKVDSVYNVSLEIKDPANYKIEYSFNSGLLPGSVAARSMLAYASNPRIHEHTEYPVVKELIPDIAIPFNLEDLSLGGYLNVRLNANLYERLLNIDETGILECFYNRPGKQNWVGEYTGKYLYAASRVWRSTKNKQLKEQMDRIVDILISCQNEDGYLGTYLPANYWTDWDAWAHKYNLLGLLSYYSVTGYKPALDACVKMGDLLCRTFGENLGQRRIIDNSPHMGMASTSILDPMTELYRFTGDKKYIDFCNYIIEAFDLTNGPKIISTLNTIGKVDKTANGKAYEMMSNLTGIVKLYQLTGDEKLLKAVEVAWNDIATNKLYITGTTSAKELFQEDFVLPANNDAHMGEGCVSMSWLRLSQVLYYLTVEPKYIDEIEKTVFNHLLAAENPETGCVSYYTALQGSKPYRCDINGHCCLASVPMGIAAIPELSYTRSTENGFSINLYSAGTIEDKIMTKEGKELSIECTIDSKFPEVGQATISIISGEKTNFRLALRVPAWCKNFKANIGGKDFNGTPGQYLYIEQIWNTKSTVKVSFDLNVHVLDGGISYPGYIAIKTGPQILAVDQKLNPEIKDLNKITISSANLEQQPKTLLPSGWIGSQVYIKKAFYDGCPVDLKLVPFADAGQTGADLRVWIKKSSIKIQK